MIPDTSTPADDKTEDAVMGKIYSKFDMLSDQMDELGRPDRRRTG
jgi:hypothetical protein